MYEKRFILLLFVLLLCVCCVWRCCEEKKNKKRGRQLSAFTEINTDICGVFGVVTKSWVLSSSFTGNSFGMEKVCIECDLNNMLWMESRNFFLHFSRFFCRSCYNNNNNNTQYKVIVQITQQTFILQQLEVKSTTTKQRRWQNLWNLVQNGSVIQLLRPSMPPRI